MKRGELVILWVGGLLSAALLIIGINPTSSVGEFFNVLAKLLAIWIVCWLVWLTLYGRHKERTKKETAIADNKLDTPLQKVFGQMLAAIELCSTARLKAPALILLYSAIEIAGWLDSEEQSVQTRFTEWVDKYLLPGSSLKCTALDLYGARCGLVHSYSSVSDLSRSGRVTETGTRGNPIRHLNWNNSSKQKWVWTDSLDQREITLLRSKSRI